MSPYTIEVTNDNPFNDGWLGYVLGLPRTYVDDPVWQDGWDTAQETPSLAGVRYVFESQRRIGAPQYVVKSGGLIPQ